MRSVCYAKATYYGMGFPPNFGGVTIFLFAALAPWPVFLQKAVVSLILLATIMLIYAGESVTRDRYQLSGYSVPILQDNSNECRKHHI